MKIGKKSVKNIVEILSMIVVYNILFYYVSEKEIVSAMLSPGSGVSRFDVVISILFISIRIVMIVFLPGRIISMLVSDNMVNDLWKRWNCPRNTPVI